MGHQYIIFNKSKSLATILFTKLIDSEGCLVWKKWKVEFKKISKKLKKRCFLG
jgi:hypothetical protein